MSHSKICAALAVLFAIHPALADERLLAVLELKSKLQGPEAKSVDAGYLADVVRSAALDASPGLRVMTRENMMVLVQAAGKSLADCEGECEVDTGRKLGADLVVSGELLKFGTKYKLDLRMHDTKEGRLLSGAQASGKTVDELDDATGAAVKKLLAVLHPASNLTAAPATAPTPAPAAAPASSGNQESARRLAEADRAAREQEAAQRAAAESRHLAAERSPAPGAAASESQLIEQALSASLSDSTARFVQGQCKENPKGCFGLAGAYANGQFELEQNGPLALALYQRACDGGELNGCTMAIGIASSGTNVKKDPARARSLGHSSCGRGCAQCCFLLQMVAGADEKPYAQEQLRGQCLGGDVDACHYALSGDTKSPQAQPLLQTMQKLCAEKKGSSCFYLKTYKEQGLIP